MRATQQSMNTPIKPAALKTIFPIHPRRQNVTMLCERDSESLAKAAEHETRVTLYGDANSDTPPWWYLIRRWRHMIALIRDPVEGRIMVGRPWDAEN
jgi:hypothetical protein